MALVGAVEAVSGPAKWIGSIEDEIWVCVTHRRFLPCRPCRRIDIGSHWSCNPQEVERVRQYRQGALDG